MMRYHNITKDDMLNGDGLRVVLWVAGCSHGCRECQNPITWDPNGGLPFTDSERAEIFAELDKDYISGITFSGGDPLHPSGCMRGRGISGGQERGSSEMERLLKSEGDRCTGVTS